MSFCAIKTAYDVKHIPMGASIAHNGVCLTVIESGPGWYTVQASAETISTTTLGTWRPEPASIWSARPGSATSWAVISFPAMWTAWPMWSRITPENESLRYVFQAPENLEEIRRSQGIGGAGRRLADGQ